MPVCKNQPKKLQYITPPYPRPFPLFTSLNLKRRRGLDNGYEFDRQGGVDDIVLFRGWDGGWLQGGGWKMPAKGGRGLTSDYQWCSEFFILPLCKKMTCGAKPKTCEKPPRWHGQYAVMSHTSTKIWHMPSYGRWMTNTTPCCCPLPTPLYPLILPDTLYTRFPHPALSTPQC